MSEQRVIEGEVLSVDCAAGTLTLGLSWVPFRGRPLTIPYRSIVPDWAREVGFCFLARCPYPVSYEQLAAEPWLLTGIEPVPFANLSVEELERMIGYNQIQEPPA